MTGGRWRALACLTLLACGPRTDWQRRHPDVLELVHECAAVTKRPHLPDAITDFELLPRSFPCTPKTDAHMCFGTARWNLGGWRVRVALVDVRTGRPTQDLRRTSLYHEVAGHVAYGWADHSHPAIAGIVVNALYANNPK